VYAYSSLYASFVSTDEFELPPGMVADLLRDLAGFFEGRFEVFSSGGVVDVRFRGRDGLPSCRYLVADPGAALTQVGTAA
jgi:hypothetical protein